MDLRQAAGSAPDDYWSRPAASLLADLASGPGGLSDAAARERLRSAGPNLLAPHQRATAARLLLGQFKSPLVLILVFATVVSAFAREWADASIILLIIVGSALLSFRQEFHATRAIDALRARVTLTDQVLRSGAPQAIPAASVVPGDIVLLSAGSLIPADGVVLEARDFYVTEAVLTGEPFPVEKRPGVVAAAAPLAERSNCVFMGAAVRSGTAQALIVQTGTRTLFGQIAERLVLRPPETQFEQGIRRFGMMLTQVMIALVLLIMTINILLDKPAIASLLFAIALAVGIAPELLPAIMSITLSRGAQRMAERGVIVRQLNAIENFGSMDILCTDKTGTLTEGVVRLDGALDPAGAESAAVLRAAALNAHFQTGMSNPLDAALAEAAEAAGIDWAGQRKIDEIPYDFERKRLSVVVEDERGQRRMITKGALEPLLAICTHVQEGAQALPLDAERRERLLERYVGWSAAGLRVLGVAVKTLEIGGAAERYGRAAECAMTFAGYLRFRDPPKAEAGQTVADLARLGVQVKIISGDNRRVVQHVAAQVGLPAGSVLSGAELHALTDEALWQRAERTSLFVEVEPHQKERIILALRKMGHVVGYLGDGINDAPALHAADVGISVDSAVDVAKEAATFLLLNHDLGVLRDGIEEGRRTFANTLKYIFTTTSANFGNMLSMAAMSLFLPFLPLLAKQILLNNFLSDFPAMTIAGDNVDREMVERPRGWDIGFIRAFMVWFGLTSSIFDFLTFGMLLFVFRASPALFQTAWFIESLLTELVIALVVRTNRPFYQSRPGKGLWRSTLAVAAITLALPYLPFSGLLGLTPLPAPLLLSLLGITALYVAGSEVVKRAFQRRHRQQPAPAAGQRTPRPAPRHHWRMHP
jgi:Mg2+-importing ATPase